MRINNPQLSIIIPVYNVEKYFSTCLDSILQQSFTDFELLLIDDGSNDQSGKICEEYAQKDKRIHVIHQVNGGVSSARNIGLNMAIGDWIYFVDADDELLPNCLELLMSNIRKDVDLVEGRYLQVNNTKPDVMPSFNGEVTFYCKSDYLYCLYRYEPKQYHGFLWNKIFRSSVIKNANLAFRQDIFFKEDGLFVIEYVCNMAQKVVYIQDLIYVYYRRATGMMRTYKRLITTKSITHLKAVSTMYNTMLTQNPSLKTRFAAKDEICRSYLMLTSKNSDKELKMEMNRILKKNVSTFYLMIYRMKRWIKKTILKN